MNPNIPKGFFFLATLFVLAWLFTLQGCEPSYGPDLTTECDFATIKRVNVIEYDTEADIVARYKEIKPGWELKPDTRLGGFETVTTRRNEAGEITDQFHTIHTLKIRGQDDKERINTLGHELLHTYCGKWHTEDRVF